MYTPDSDTAADAVAEMLELIAADPLAGAEKLEEMGNGLLELARRLRETAPPSGFRDPGGMTDRVKMSVVGPDGTVRQTIDTGD